MYSGFVLRKAAESSSRADLHFAFQGGKMYREAESYARLGMKPFEESKI
jgi:hypothetical protein